MTTARRTTLVRLLHLEMGYEQDTSPSVVASAILEALEPTLIDEMGIVFIREGGSTDPPILTLYAPLDQVRREQELSDSPLETPRGEGESAIERLQNAIEEENDRKPNVG